MCRFASIVVYYGLSLSTSSLAGDKYVNFFLSGAVEAPAYGLTVIVLQKFVYMAPIYVDKFTDFYDLPSIAIIEYRSINDLLSEVTRRTPFTSCIGLSLTIVIANLLSCWLFAPFHTSPSYTLSPGPGVLENQGL